MRKGKDCEHVHEKSCVRTHSEECVRTYCSKYLLTVFSTTYSLYFDFGDLKSGKSMRMNYVNLMRIVTERCALSVRMNRGVCA